MGQDRKLPAAATCAYFPEAKSGTLSELLVEVVSHTSERGYSHLLGISVGVLLNFSHFLSYCKR